MKTTATVTTTKDLSINPTTDNQRHYLKFITNIETMAEGHRYWVHVADDFLIEVSICYHDLSCSYDLMRRWKKAGYIKEMYNTHIGLNTYFTDCNGNCYGYYNPANKRSDDGKRMVVDFDFLREYTPENAAELIAEAIRMYEMDIRH